MIFRLSEPTVGTLCCKYIYSYQRGMTVSFRFYTCVGYVEMDKFARKAYEAIFQTKGERTAYDITTVSDTEIERLKQTHGPINVICHGFPCQAFSALENVEDSRALMALAAFSPNAARVSFRSVRATGIRGASRIAPTCLWTSS